MQDTFTGEKLFIIIIIIYKNLLNVFAVSVHGC